MGQGCALPVAGKAKALKAAAQGWLSLACEAGTPGQQIKMGRGFLKNKKIPYTSEKTSWPFTSKAQAFMYLILQKASIFKYTQKTSVN